jgi:hypothetical protein
MHQMEVGPEGPGKYGQVEEAVFESHRFEWKNLQEGRF